MPPNVRLDTKIAPRGPMPRDMASMGRYPAAAGMPHTTRMSREIESLTPQMRPNPNAMPPQLSSGHFVQRQQNAAMMGMRGAGSQMGVAPMVRPQVSDRPVLSRPHIQPSLLPRDARARPVGLLRGNEQTNATEIASESRLSSLCEAFLMWFSRYQQATNEINVAQVASHLNAPLQRIFDIMEILCGLGIVVRKASEKSTPNAARYNWQGLAGLQSVVENILQDNFENKLNAVLGESEASKKGAKIHKLPTTSLLSEMDADDEENGNTGLDETKNKSASAEQPSTNPPSEPSSSGSDGKSQEGEGSLMARKLVSYFVRNPSDRVVSLQFVHDLLGSGDSNKTEQQGADGESKASDLKVLDQIFDAIDVLRALELCCTVQRIPGDAGHGSKSSDPTLGAALGAQKNDSFALMWVGSDVLGNLSAASPRNRESASARATDELEDSENYSLVEPPSAKPRMVDVAKRMPRYLKKSLAAMRRRRVGGRFVASMKKRTEKENADARSFFALVPDVEGLRSVQKIPFRQAAWSYHHGRVGIRSCRCVKSQCENRYCDCYASGTACLNCACVGCKNKTKPLVRKRPSVTKGCRCRKSQCAKGHCDCFAAGKSCGVHCGCINCANPLGTRKVSVEKEKKLKESGAGPSKSGGGLAGTSGDWILPIEESDGTVLYNKWKPDSAFTRLKLPEPPSKSTKRRNVNGRRGRNRARARIARRKPRRRAAASGRGVAPRRGRKSRGRRVERTSPTMRAAQQSSRDWKQEGHALLGKNIVRVLGSKAESGKIIKWVPAAQGKNPAIFLIKFSDGELFECSLAFARSGVRQARLCIGASVRVLCSGAAWKPGVIKKVSYTTNPFKPYGIQLHGRRAGLRLTWAARTDLRLPGERVDEEVDRADADAAFFAQNGTDDSDEETTDATDYAGNFAKAERGLGGETESSDGSTDNQDMIYDDEDEEEEDAHQSDSRSGPSRRSLSALETVALDLLAAASQEKPIADTKEEQQAKTPPAPATKRLTVGIRCRLCRAPQNTDEERGPARWFDKTLVHLNCAKFSKGARCDPGDPSRILNVPELVAEAEKFKCSLCGEPGATMPCAQGDCTQRFHAACAVKAYCVMDPEASMLKNNWLFFCRDHSLDFEAIGCTAAQSLQDWVRVVSSAEKDAEKDGEADVANDKSPQRGKKRKAESTPLRSDAGGPGGDLKGSSSGGSKYSKQNGSSAERS